METWKTNLDETKKRYIDWWNHKGIILNMWEHFQEGVKPHADIPAPSPAKDLNQKWFDPQWRAEYLDWYVAHSSLKADIPAGSQYPVRSRFIGSHLGRRVRRRGRYHLDSSRSRFQR